MNIYNKEYYVFTNDSGRAVFIHNDIFVDLNISDSGKLIGEPLNKVLGINSILTSKWLELVKRDRQLTHIKQEIEFMGSTGAHLALLDFSSVVDKKANFKGADITIRFIQEGAELKFMEPTGAVDKEEETKTDILSTYFVERMIALRVMTLRMAGINLGKGIDNVFNQYAAKNSLAISSNDGFIAIDAVNQLDPNQIKNIFSHMTGYITGITSPSLVESVLEEFDKKQDAHDLSIIKRLWT